MKLTALCAAILLAFATAASAQQTTIRDASGPDHRHGEH